MILEAVYHSTDSEYCHAVDEKTIVLRLRAKKGDIKKCIAFFGNRVYPKEYVPMESREMHVAASDRFFDYFEAVINVDFPRICYYFVLEDGNTSVFFYGNDFHDYLGSDRNQYYQIPYIRKTDIADVPEWVKRAVIYQIFPDSFASSKSYISGESKEISVGNGMCCRSRLGGNLKGIMENIPYLQELGVNCIYLNPVFTARSDHKYNTIDYYTVDPCFGDNQTLKELVAKCHASGIRVLLDGVFNHAGSDFFAFRDVMEKGEKSKYRDWFFIQDFPVRHEENPNYLCFAYEKTMPKINTENSEVIKYFSDVGAYWIKEADIDGWRLDVADEVDHNFWRQFRKAVKAVKPDAFLLAEIWYDSKEWLRGDQFDSVMNYDFRRACIDYFAERLITVEQFDSKINYLRMRYKKNIQYVQMNLLDSHDVSRFLSLAGEDIRRQKVAALFMMMHVGVPSIFAGDEKGMAGMAENEYRRPMQWEDTDYSKDILDYYKKLISIRKENMEIMLGDYVTISKDLLHNTYVFSREANGEKLIIAINNSEYPVEINVDTGKIPGSVKELLGDTVYTVKDSGVTLGLEAVSGAVLKV